MIDLRNTFGKDVIAKRTLDIIITKIENGHSNTNRWNKIYG